MRKLRYNGGLGPSVRAAGVEDWRTGDVHEIKYDGIAKSLMKSGRFTDVTEAEVVKPAAKPKTKPFVPPVPDDVPMV